VQVKLNKKILGGVVIIVIIAVGLGVVFGTGYDKPHRTITTTGSTTVLPIAQRCAEEWTSTRNPSRTHPYYDEINVAGGGSGVGIADMLQGTNDIADSSRPMKDSEIADAIAKGINPVQHKIALDGVSIIVHPSNPVTGLTMDQIKNIYTGAITNWKQVGGPDATIVVYNRESTSGTYETFETKVMHSEPIRADALEKTSNGAMKEAVANDPNGIAYVGLGYVDSSVKAVTVDGITASAGTVRSGKYPIARYLFMITNGELSAQTNTLVKDFINFVLSTEGQQLVIDEGFISLHAL
jgi:phosphate transport system substrate-binding protein